MTTTTSTHPVHPARVDTRPAGATAALTDCVVVVNPAAGNVDEDLVRRIVSAARRSPLLTPGSSVHVARTHAPGQAGSLAAAAAAELVLAVGGDGTASEVTQALADAGGPGRVLGVVPAGTGNSTARALWGDRSVDQVLELLLTDAAADAVRVRTLDLIHLHEPGVLSILGTSTGFLAQVLVDVPGVDPAVRGYDRYLAAALEVLQDMPDHPTRVTVDGRVLREGRLSSVAVGGGRFRARSFEFLPESLLDDGLLDVSTIDALAGDAVDEIAALIPTGAHLGRPDVTYARGRTVVVERTDGRPLVAEYDGSLVDVGTRLTVEVRPAALRVLSATDVEGWG